MSALFLTEKDVHTLIDMRTSIDVVEDAFRRLSNSEAMNAPRQRVRTSGVMLHTMSASAEDAGFVGWKAYTTTRSGARFLVGLYDALTGELRLLVEADLLGQLRTGAASGVATRYLARTSAETVGVFGAGLQAQTQLQAVCSVRSIRHVEVYCRDESRRREFAARMSGLCSTRVVAAADPVPVAENKDIVICATTSKRPVFPGESLGPGTHVNAIGGNMLSRQEIDGTTIQRADHIVCDNIEQCRIESGELVDAADSGLIDWSDVAELGDIADGRRAGRQRESDITLFKSVGLAIQDVAMAAELFRRATTRKFGSALPF